MDPRTSLKDTNSLFFSFCSGTYTPPGGRVQANCRQPLGNRCRFAANRYRLTSQPSVTSRPPPFGGRLSLFFAPQNLFSPVKGRPGGPKLQ